MKVTIAIDSFKGSLSSIEAGNAVKKGIKKVYPNADIHIFPVSDGGEGFAESLILGMNGSFYYETITGPIGEPLVAQYSILEDTHTAIIEISKAAGITLVPEDKRNPLYTTTYGIGELIKSAIQKGCRHFIVGIGGSATNDGGVGMLQALGYDFLDGNGEPIPHGALGLEHLTVISKKHVLPELKDCTFQIACDVTNPLCGTSGCSTVYGPQKGATPEMIPIMDNWLYKYAKIAKETFPNADPAYPGTGAAGGLGFAFLTFTNAMLAPGIDIVLEVTKMQEHIIDSDYVITGEGNLDGQTVMGKAPIGIAKLAKQYHKPVLAFSGSVTKDATLCNEYGIDAYFPILQSVISLKDAMSFDTASKNLTDTTEQVFRLIQTIRS